MESRTIVMAYSRMGKRNREAEVHSKQIFSSTSATPVAEQKDESIRVDEEGCPFLLDVPRCRRSKRAVFHQRITAASETEVCLEQSMEQHTRQLPFVSHPCARRSTRKRGKHKILAEESDDCEQTTPSLGALHWRGHSKRRMSRTSAIIQQQGKLDTDMFEHHLETLWGGFSEEKRNSFAYLDCLWFSLYAKESFKAKVLNWIKKKDIFSKKYVFIPIIQWCHWSLLIFCHFGENLQSKTKTPCMLLLDSLKMTDPKRLEPGIRKAEERPESRKLIHKIPLLVPKVPQQRNGEECGKFVLYYINLFVESAPENFSIVEGYPYFMNEDWFTPEGFECFCGRLDAKSERKMN